MKRKETDKKHYTINHPVYPGDILYAPAPFLAEFRANDHDTRSQDRLALKVPYANFDLVSNIMLLIKYLKLETHTNLREFKALLVVVCRSNVSVHVCL